MNGEDIEARIAALTEQVDALIAERQRLREILAGPRVEIERVFWRYGLKIVEPDPLSCTVDEAFAGLDAAQDFGELSPVGVKVGGALITMKEWRA